MDGLIAPGHSNAASAAGSDPLDEMFLSCALDAGADLIGSGDHHLMDLGEYEGTRMVTVQEFFERLEKSGSDLPSSGRRG